jgi:hypothetical protein
VAHALVSRSFIRTDFFPMSLALLGVLGGAVLGVLGSALSVGRHLRRIQ